jgi:hypothetical protein
MMTPLFLALAAPVSHEADIETWVCEAIPNEASEPHTPPHEDLTLQRKSANAGQLDKWTVAWPGKLAIATESFEAAFGSVGGSAAFRWADEKGQKRQAFISFSDMVLADGTKAAWLGLDKPSLWQPPGYMCATTSQTGEKAQ